MATKDLIKRLKSSKDVKPMQVKPIEVVKLDEKESVEERIKEEMESMEKVEETPNREYMDKKFKKLENRLYALEERYDSIADNMELIMINKEQVNDLLEFLEQAKEKKPNLLQRLIRKCQ